MGRVHETIVAMGKAINITYFSAWVRACAKLRKATTNFVMYVRPSALTNSAPTGRFWWNLIFEGFFFCWKSVKIQVSSKSDKNNRYFYMKTFSHLWQYLAEFFLEWEIFRIKVVEKIKTHISCSVTLLRKSYRLWHNVEKWIRKTTRQQAYALASAPTLSRTHARTRGHTHKPICSIYRFSTATIVSWTRLIVTL